ncbi:5-(carboxyamino)imidazole ribonucleotide mutase [Bdellovibrio sp. HCB337]|uniref:5-(carboxyamino)imidazole ribonucleotide mutase n=1 Tax=Bdellovibrio sp. HCB337 TaxID=3394358 RepID=UPI0039A50D7C
MSKAKSKSNKNDVLIVMGSISDHATMKRAEEILKSFGVGFTTKIVSAHRSPDLLFEEGQNAFGNYKVIIAGAGGAAHLPGMMASLTTLPVIGVPVPHGSLGGKDALYSIVQMPEGIPVATVAIGGAGNAALLAIQILATSDDDLSTKLVEYKEELREKVAEQAKKL